MFWLSHSQRKCAGLHNFVSSFSRISRFINIHSFLSIYKIIQSTPTKRIPTAPLLVRDCLLFAGVWEVVLKYSRKLGMSADKWTMSVSSPNKGSPLSIPVNQFPAAEHSFYLQISSLVGKKKQTNKLKTPLHLGLVLHLALLMYVMSYIFLKKCLSTALHCWVTTKSNTLV